MESRCLPSTSKVAGLIPCWLFSMRLEPGENPIMETLISQRSALFSPGAPVSYRTERLQGGLGAIWVHSNWLTGWFRCNMGFTVIGLQGGLGVIWVHSNWLTGWFRCNMGSQ